MILCTLKVNISSEKHDAALHLVRSMMGPTRAQPGCSGITFCQDTDEADSMILLEEWEDWKSIERHICSDSYRNILALMDLSMVQPDFRVYEISRKQGMAVIEEIRS